MVTSRSWSFHLIGISKDGGNFLCLAIGKFGGHCWWIGLCTFGFSADEKTLELDWMMMEDGNHGNDGNEINFFKGNGKNTMYDWQTSGFRNPFSTEALVFPPALHHMLVQMPSESGSPVKLTSHKPTMSSLGMVSIPPIYGHTSCPEMVYGWVPLKNGGLLGKIIYEWETCQPWD